jgi:hypothetical protein
MHELRNLGNHAMLLSALQIGTQIKDIINRAAIVTAAQAAGLQERTFWPSSTPKGSRLKASKENSCAPIRKGRGYLKPGGPRTKFDFPCSLGIYT